MSLRGWALLGLIVVGCGRPPSDKGEWVTQTVQERIHKDVYWQRQFEGAVAERVLTLLAQPLTADTAVQIALLNSPRLQAEFEEIGIAHAELWQAGLLRNPVFGAALLFPSSSSYVKGFEFSLTGSVVDVFLRPMRQETARWMMRETSSRVADAVLNLAAEVERSFIRLQAAEKGLEQQALLLKAAEVAQELAMRQKAVGNTNAENVLTYTAAAQNARVELAEKEAERAELHTQLQQLMGLQVEAWTISLRQSSPAEGALASEPLVERALSNRLDVIEKRQEIERLCEQGAQNSWWTYTDAQLGIMTERAPEGFHATGPSLDLALPIFDHGQAERAKWWAQVQKARQQHAALVVMVRAQVQSAVQRLELFRKLFQRYDSEIVPEHEAQLAQTLKLYNVMNVGVFDLLRAKEALIQSKIDAVSVLEAYWLAAADLTRAIAGQWIGEGNR